MFVYLITQHEYVPFESYDSHVIAAGSAIEARTMAKRRAADERQDVWDRATVTRLGPLTTGRKLPYVILSSYRAG
jgi:hypothetical protein